MQRRHQYGNSNYSDSLAKKLPNKEINLIQPNLPTIKATRQSQSHRSLNVRSKIEELKFLDISMKNTQRHEIQNLIRAENQKKESDLNRQNPGSFPEKKKMGDLLSRFSTLETKLISQNHFTKKTETGKCDLRKIEDFFFIFKRKFYHSKAILPFYQNWGFKNKGKINSSILEGMSSSMGMALNQDECAFLIDKITDGASTELNFNDFYKITFNTDASKIFGFSNSESNGESHPNLNSATASILSDKLIMKDVFDNVGKTSILKTIKKTEFIKLIASKKGSDLLPSELEFCQNLFKNENENSETILKKLKKHINKLDSSFQGFSEREDLDPFFKFIKTKSRREYPVSFFEDAFRKIVNVDLKVTQSFESDWRHKGSASRGTESTNCQEQFKPSSTNIFSTE